MIAIDTNVLVRYLVDDDPAQNRSARQFVERAIRDSDSIFVANVVLCELVWVLSHAYEIQKAEIVRTLRQILNTADLIVESHPEAARAMELYGNGSGDFADYLIAEIAQGKGCTVMVTFDKTLIGKGIFVSP